MHLLPDTCVLRRGHRAGYRDTAAAIHVAPVIRDRHVDRGRAGFAHLPFRVARSGLVRRASVMGLPGEPMLFRAGRSQPARRRTAHSPHDLSRAATGILVVSITSENN